MTFTEGELERFGEASSTFGVDWTGSVGLRRWRFFQRRNLSAVIHRALLELGVPSHFSYITDQVNRIAPDARKRDGHAVTVAMLRYPESFVSLGRGIYALRDWGVTRPPFLKDFLATAIRERGGRALGEDLAAYGFQRFAFKKNSVKMTLSMNPRYFRSCGNDWYEGV
jgi:hypothetical protein